MLELKHISYAVREGDSELGILNDISLTIDDHRLVVFTGPNGGGKTTLAKIIMGLVKPTGGQILWNGQDITDLGITERARLGISYGFQQPPRFKGLTVRNLLTIASGNEKLSKDQCCQYLTKVGLCANDYLDREVDASLSGGEVKRIEIATILARKSGLMIFDEPEAGIDLWSFAKLTETFRAIHQKREATLIVISHQERIIDLADEIVMIRDGKIAKHGPKDEILERYGQVGSSAAQLAALEPELLTRVRRGEFGCHALVADRAAFQRVHPEIPVEPVTLDDIMLFVGKGEAV